MYAELFTNNQRLSVSVIAAYELEKGAKLSQNTSRDLKLIREFISELEILNLDVSIVDSASELYAELSGAGKKIGEFDILIAATCLVASETLVTNDKDFDVVPNLVKVHY